MLPGIFRKLNSDNLQLKTTTDISWKYCRFAELRQGESAVDEHYEFTLANYTLETNCHFG